MLRYFSALAGLAALSAAASAQVPVVVSSGIGPYGRAFNTTAPAIVAPGLYYHRPLSGTSGSLGYGMFHNPNYNWNHSVAAIQLNQFGGPIVGYRGYNGGPGGYYAYSYPNVPETGYYGISAFPAFGWPGSYGLAPFGGYSWFPGLSTYDDFLMPPAAVPPQPEPRMQTIALGDQFPATLKLQFPAAARVWLDGKEVEGSAAPERTLTSPVLRRGENYVFHVKATWDVDGKTYETTREVKLGSGDSSRLMVVSGTPVSE